MSPTDTGKIIQKEEIPSETQVDIAIMEFIRTLEVDFPASAEMSAMARKIYHQVFDHEENITLDPDKEIVSWTEMEYNLFRKLEFDRYGDIIARGFTTVDQFIEVANMVLNRRKSRAGKSLEHHLSAILTGNRLPYESQPQQKVISDPTLYSQVETHIMILPGRLTNLYFLGPKQPARIDGDRS